MPMSRASTLKEHCPWRTNLLRSIASFESEVALKGRFGSEPFAKKAMVPATHSPTLPLPCSSSFSLFSHHLPTFLTTSPTPQFQPFVSPLHNIPLSQGPPPWPWPPGH